MLSHEVPFQDLFELAPDATVIVDSQGVIQLVNAQVERWFGYQPQELPGQPIEILIPEAIRELHQRHRSTYSTNPRTRPMGQGLDLLARRKDGSVFPVEISLSPLQVKGEYWVIASIRDVSEQRQTLESLRQQSLLFQLLRDIAIASNESVSTHDTLQFALDRICAHTGWPVGHVYLPAHHPGGEMVSARIWHLDDPERFAIFRQITEMTPLAPSVGLVGTVVTTQSPQWISDVSSDPKFVRTQRSNGMDLGVHGAFAFPVLVGPEVVAVLEFFSPHRADPDLAFLEAMIQIGIQLGRVVERERAAGVMAEQTRHLREQADLLDQTHDAIVVRSLDGTIRYWNRGAEAVYGWSAEQALGERSHILLATTFPTSHEEIEQILLRNGRWEGELRHRRHDGAVVTVESRWTLQRDEQQTPIGILEINSDITQRKRAEEEANRFFNVSIDMLCIAGFDGYFKRINPSFERNLGWRAEDLTAVPFLEFVHPDDRAATLAEMEKLTGGTPTFYFTNRYRCADGSYKWLQWMAIPYIDDGLMYGVARDVTDEKRLQEALVHQARELKRSNDELAQFAYVASHDLQEPLRMVASYMQLLARRYRGQLDATADAFIAYAVDGAQRMQVLIWDLLAYSHVTTRGNPFTLVEGDAVLQRALTNLKLAIEESGAILTVESLPTLVGDEIQLVQLFQNLISNAIKFRYREPPHIHISAEQDNQQWIITIRDNGIGIDPQYAERIFLVFQRLHTREEYPGTGIGLAICKKIVERHGGRIWVESQPQEGATFYVALPVNATMQTAYPPASIGDAVTF
ncbi:MAG: hypothetical protein KatS3mg057_0011 [Herpetosiphonaceae bacterium]|nr:MAG: hypothetical protein KatS3mg057_0011 [Herpetosiphonaceae bacterium]